jgi:hypothetical protein
MIIDEGELITLSFDCEEHIKYRENDGVAQELASEKLTDEFYISKKLLLVLMHSLCISSFKDILSL